MSSKLSKQNPSRRARAQFFRQEKARLREVAFRTPRFDEATLPEFGLKPSSEANQNGSTAWQIEAVLPDDQQITPALKTSPSLDAFIAKLSLQMGLPVTDQHAILAAAMPPRYGQTGIDPGGWRATSLPAVSVQRFRPCLQEL
jgi:hypothetical protein